MVKPGQIKSVKTKWVLKLFPEARVLVSVGKEVKRDDGLVSFGKEKEEKFDASSILSKLKREQVEEFVGKWKGKNVKEGEIMFSSGGLLPKRIYCPIEAKFIGVDEFFNLRFEVPLNKKENILAPIAGKVVSIDKERLELEFRALKFDGEGLAEGRVWGNIDDKIYSRVSELNSQLKGKIILAENIDRIFLMKAEVVGVGGLVTDREIDIEDADVNMPILFLNKDSFTDLTKILTKEVRALLNSKVGRLLVVE